MSTTAVERRRGGLIDRRLASRVSATRRYLLTAVGGGLASTVCVVAQAVLLASVVSSVLLHGASLGATAPRLGGLAAAYLARASCSWAGEAAAQRTGAAVTSALRRQLLRHALDLGPVWLSGERAGELSLSATRGTTALTTYFGRYLPQAVLAAVAPLAILAWVASEDWPSLLILLAIAGLVPLAMVHFGRESAARTKRQWRRLSSLSARFLDMLRGLPTLRAFCREAHGRREVAEATEGLRQTMLSTLRVAFVSALALEFLAGIGTGLVAMVLGLRLLGGHVSLYTALAVLLVSPEVFLPLRRAAAEFHASAEGQAAADRILSVLDVAAAPAAPRGPTARDAARRDGERPQPPTGTRARELRAPLGVGPRHDARDGPSGRGLHSVLHAEAVTVSFAGRGAAALEEFSLEVAAGEHVALVGPSGSGKSTALALFLGFVRPTSGSVLVDGDDLCDLDVVTWRRRVAWVPQRPHLLHGSIEDNLRIADPDATATQLIHAIEMVGLAHTVAGLPGRLATPVGDGGVSLSAGERQRVALARAVIRNAPVVLLDEPVAHLDAHAEASLRDALGEWLETRTVLVAAHRPELVALDRVVRLGAAARAQADRDPHGRSGGEGGGPWNNTTDTGPRDDGDGEDLWP
ncbi:MAG TPA: thiol reductant ABC exporter subunit CydD [Acidimicrobiales bacterium]|nr:thiol reductant ABC exporter subunit CydD [Acidimicrobiales bacterium]